jgi:hypothetical protein
VGQGNSADELNFNPVQETFIQTDGMVNRIINGDMRISQRYAGTAYTVNTAAVTYGLDRWGTFGQAASEPGVYTVKQETTSPPPGFSHYMQCKTTTADAAVIDAARYFIIQRIETDNVSDLSLGTANASSFTLSFYVRSSLTGQFGGAFLASGARSYPFTFTITDANTWELKSITVVGDTANAGGERLSSGNDIGLQVAFDLGCGLDYTGTANAWVSASNWGADSDTKLISVLNATLDLTAVQLVKGTTAPTYLPRAYETEFRMCQRYYYRFATGNQLFLGYRNSTTLCDFTIIFPNPMRSAGTLETSSPTYANTTPVDNEIAVYDVVVGYATTAGNVTLSIYAAQSAGTMFRFSSTQNFAGSAGEICQLHMGGSCMLAVGCEL